MASKLENACLTTCEIQPSGTTSCVTVNGSNSDKITYMIASNFNSGYLKKPTSTKITNNSDDNTITTLAVASGKTPDLPVCCVKQGSKNLQFCVGSDGKFCVVSNFSLGSFEGTSAPLAYMLKTSEGYIPIGYNCGSLGSVYNPFFNKSSSYYALRMSCFKPTINDNSTGDCCSSYMMTAKNTNSSNIKDIIVFDKKDTDVYVCLCYHYEINVLNCGRQIDYSYCYCPKRIYFNLENPRQRVMLCVKYPEDWSSIEGYIVHNRTSSNTVNHIITSRMDNGSISDVSRLCAKFTGQIGYADAGGEDTYYNCTLTLKPKVNLLLLYNKHETARYSKNCSCITLASIKIDCNYEYGDANNNAENKTYSGKGEVKVNLT